MHKSFFMKLASILILNLKHCNDYSDNSYTSSFGDSAFYIHKELYMDRYLLTKVNDVDRRWYELESLKSELENIDQNIKKITDYQVNIILR